MAEPFPTGYLNGEFLPLAAAKISPFDRGFLFADGVYEVVPVHRGRAFLLRAHLDRLARSLAAIRLPNPHTHAQWAGIVQGLASRAGAPEQLVYLQVTRGAEYGRNHPFPAGVAPTVFGFTGPYTVPPAQLLDGGLAAVTREDIRWARCDIKSIALLANVLLREEAGDAGGSEAILLRDGELTEGSSSTVFVVTGGRLVTPPNDPRILPGTTREAVLALAQEIQQEIRPVSAAELAQSTEIWIASAGRGVLPVTRLDGRPVGDGRPGSHWRRTYASLQRHLDQIASEPAL
ncbi:MAG TPA: D-amino acid aminotransferase [Steroidobacteraceae bacterium]